MLAHQPTSPILSAKTGNNGYPDEYLYGLVYNTSIGKPFQHAEKESNPFMSPRFCKYGRTKNAKHHLLGQHIITCFIIT